MSAKDQIDSIFSKYTVIEKYNESADDIVILRVAKDTHDEEDSKITLITPLNSIKGDTIGEVKEQWQNKFNSGNTFKTKLSNDSEDKVNALLDLYCEKIGDDATPHDIIEYENQ